MEKMKINVRESCIICPSQETPKNRLWLSNLDLILARVHFVPLVYLYKPDGSSNFFDPGVLKEALSKVMVEFYPIAGRFGRDKNGRIELRCNGEGVLFREAESDSSMDVVGELSHGEMVKLLVPVPDPSSPISSYSVFVAQVTRFKCGGVSLGIGLHHGVADGTAALHLINSWSDLARGIPIKVPPIIDRTILRSRKPPTPTFNHVEYDPPPSLKTQSIPKTNTLAILNISTDQINALKAKAHSNNNEIKYSTFELLTAHIWKCVCKARNLPHDQETKLNFSVNGRGRFDPPIPSEYFGNAMFYATPVALCGEIASEPVTQTVERINKEIKRRDDEYLRSAIDYLELVSDLSRVRNGADTMNSPNLKIVSWTRLPFKDADFGWGRPFLFRGTNPVEGKGHLSLSATEEGGLSLAICLEVECMKLFQSFFYDFHMLGNCRL